MMKKNLSTFFALVLTLSFAAAVSFASYGEPTASAPTGPGTGNNSYGPLDTGSTTQNKPAGVSLSGGLVVKNTTQLGTDPEDMTIFTGPVAGALTGSSTVRVGDQSHAVSLLVNQNVEANTLQSDTLKGVGKRELCSDEGGVIYVCP